MRPRALAFAVGTIASASAIMACSLRDTSYLKAGGASPSEAGADNDVATPPVDGSTPTRTATTIASGQAGPRLLVQDDSAIYWVTNDGNVSALKKDGSETTPRTVGNVGTSVTSMAAEPGSGPNLFYTSGGEVRRIPKAGGSPSLVGATTPAPRALAVDATHVFAMSDDDTSADPSSITRFPNAGGAGQMIFSSDASYIGAIAVEGDNVFWDSLDNRFNSLPKNASPDAGPPTSYRPTGDADESSITPFAFAVDGQAFYYSNGTDVRSFKRQETGVATQLLFYEVESVVNAIAIDDRYVYAIDAIVNGTLRRAQKDGLGAAETMLAALLKPTSLAVDSTSVYLAVEGTPGAILKCTK